MSTWFLIHEEYDGAAGMLACAVAIAALCAYLAVEMFRDWLTDRRFR
jgi:hypothetical protein